MDENSRFNKAIKNNVWIFIFALVMAFICLIILKYHVEGEQNMPFELEEILVVSSAEGYQEKESKKNNWEVEIYQTNDIYINIKKNKNYKSTEIIRSIEIKNVSINEEPKEGKIEIYVPSSDEQVYTYNKKYKIDNNITYEGDTKSDLKNLKISNQGGTIIFRIVNITGKEYISNDNELKHNGTLLDKVKLSSEDIRTDVSFDIVINLESDISFTGTVNLKLPIGNIETQGITNLDKKDINDIIFKRE